MDAAVLAGTIVFSAGSAFAVTKWRLDRADKDLDVFKEESWGQIDELRKFRHTHEKESSDYRLAFQTSLSDLRGLMLVRDEQYKEIIRRIEELSNKLDQKPDR